MQNIEVTARCFDPFTGVPTSEPRAEIIDMKTNALFRSCETLTDVSETYMEFWNRLPTVQSELVLVQSIRWMK